MLGGMKKKNETKAPKANANTIRVDVDERIQRFDLDVLEPLQGPLKSLSEDDFEKLKKSILEEGFFAPLFLWHSGKSIKIIDGHQRVRVLQKLREEGVTIPKIPAVTIYAKNKAQALKRLLLTTSAFGKIQRDGLYELIEELGDPAALMNELSLPGVESKGFIAEYYQDIEGAEPPKGASEISSERFEKFSCKCPKCGFEFDAQRDAEKK